MAEYRERMGRRITEARKREGLTREELAARSGVSFRQVQRIETGKADPRNGTLRSLAEVLKADAAELRPNVEEEEEALREQLDRIEAKLDELLSDEPQRPSNNNSA